MDKLIQDIFLGGNLKELRKRHGYTQVSLIAKLQIMGSSLSRTTYSKIESGSRNIYVSDLIRLSRIYSESFDEFFKDIEI